MPGTAILALALLAAILIAVISRANRATPEPTPAPVPLAQHPGCDGAHCWRRGTIPAINNDGTHGNYCPGCHRLGTFMGWITPTTVTLKAVAPCTVCGARTTVPCDTLEHVTRVLNDGGITCATCQDVLDAAEQEFTA